MIAAALRLPNGEVRSDLSESEIAQAFEDHESLLWVDLEDPTDKEAEILARIFKFHPLAIDDCLNNHVDPPKVDDYGDYLFLIIQGIRVEGAADRIETTELNIFLGINYVVTFHDAVFPSVTQLRERCLVEAFPAIQRGADFLTQQLIDGLVDDFLPEVQELDDLTDMLEEQVIRQPQSELLEQVLLLKRNTLRLRRALLPQRDVVNRLSRGEFPKFIRPEILIFYRDIYDHLVRVEELVETNRDLAEGVLTTYLSVVANRTNDVMKWLALVSTLILPPTLVAGLYGMNFDFMPELHWQFGYPFALGLMVTFMVSLVMYFRSRRWI